MKTLILICIAAWYSGFMIYVFMSMIFNGVYYLHEYNHLILYGELAANVAILIFAVYCLANFIRRLRHDETDS